MTDPPTILALIAEVERLSRYAPSPEVEALLARSSFGTDDAEAARESVSPDAGRLVVRLSQVMAERDALQAQVDAVKALHSPIEVEPSATICAECSIIHGTGEKLRFFPLVEWPCPTIAALGETGDGRDE